jgi:glycerol-3-phosphate dehydrogenase (NAD(P)+)
VKIGYLGTGAWAFALISLLASKGHKVTAWGRDASLIDQLKKSREHPKLPGFPCSETIKFTSSLEEAINGADLIVEGVTGAGVRPVFTTAKALISPKVPIVLTSKGVEQGTDLFLSDVLIDVLGEEHRSSIGCLSGPSLAIEVLKKFPTSVVGAGYEVGITMRIQETFTTPYFSVYPNTDIAGVELGGAMKNVIAIACGICTGMGFGDNTKAALMTRGWHEVRKLARHIGCDEATLNGLSGMADLCATCISPHSRNSRLGQLLAQGFDYEAAQAKIGMVIEGAYSCVSAWEMVERNQIEAPIIRAVYRILQEGLSPRNAVRLLLEKEVKDERL